MDELVFFSDESDRSDESDLFDFAQKPLTLPTSDLSDNPTLPIRSQIPQSTSKASSQKATTKLLFFFLI